LWYCRYGLHLDLKRTEGRVHTDYPNVRYNQGDMDFTITTLLVFRELKIKNEFWNGKN